MHRHVANGRCRQRPYGGGGGRKIGANITAKWADTQVCPYNAHIVAQYANTVAKHPTPT